MREERVGRTRQVRANTQSLLFNPLQRLMALTFGPVPVLNAELHPVARIERAFVYGSWAARHSGVPGPEPKDVDVLVVGDPDPEELYAAGERARRRLGREVNIHQLAADAWTDVAGHDPFLSHLRESPLVEIDLDGQS